jgi:hypothetical protein
MFEELVMDLYEEVDRRETETSKILFYLEKKKKLEMNFVLLNSMVYMLDKS